MKNQITLRLTVKKIAVSLKGSSIHLSSKYNSQHIVIKKTGLNFQNNLSFSCSNSWHLRCQGTSFSEYAMRYSTDGIRKSHIFGTVLDVGKSLHAIPRIHQLVSLKKLRE